MSLALTLRGSAWCLTSAASSSCRWCCFSIISRTLAFWAAILSCKAAFCSARSLTPSSKALKAFVGGKAVISKLVDASFCSCTERQNLISPSPCDLLTSAVVPFQSYTVCTLQLDRRACYRLLCKGPKLQQWTLHNSKQDFVASVLLCA